MMKTLFALLLSFATISAASADCPVGEQIEVSGTVEKYHFEHAGNGEPITATILKLDRPVCQSEEKTLDVLQLLPEDYTNAREFVPGQKITIKGLLSYPGDTAWYPSFHILFYPVK
jgi:hypothetical protein